MNIKNQSSTNIDSFSISETAFLFSVSTATIRNWLKMNYLQLSSKGMVSAKSINIFKDKYLGKLKLNKRANKSQKDYHDHKALILKFNEEMYNIDAEKLGDLYEVNLSNTYRNKEGIYYTPSYIVKDLFKIFNDVKDKTFCDPCCGSGNFIIQAIELGFKPENIYGFDIDPIAVEITKRRIYKKTGYKSENIFCLDFLSDIVIEKKYDYIYTNPPWGKKIGKFQKINIAQKLKTNLYNDTSSLFFAACLKNLNTNGILGLLLPESFYNISAFENAREELLNYKIHYLIDYGKIFKELQTGAVAFILSKNNIEKENYQVLCQYQNNLFYRNRYSFINNPKKIINLYCDSQEEKLISYLYSLEYITLSGNAKWALGIVTGNNQAFISKEKIEGYIPVIKGSDIKITGLNKATNFISPDFSLYQQVAPLEYFLAKEKLIYRFISSELVFYYDTEQHFVLNSANIIITNERFPVSMKVLSDIFNSNLMRWLFKKIFNTHKILRGDLEYLPIFSQFIHNDYFDKDSYLNSLNIEEVNNGTFRIKE